MNTSEKRSTLAIAGIFSLRMLGLFMILPVFAPYGSHLIGSTPFLVGLAIGIYGLSQALLQIPFGLLSDKIGRKPVILLGLILFAIGSLVAASSDSITGVIVGRCLQGAGAIGSTCMALLADTTEDEHRGTAMAIMGMIIATSFFIAMILGPITARWLGVKGIFYLTVAFACAGMVLLLCISQAKKLLFHSDMQVTVSFIKQVLKNTELLRLNLSIFISHAILTASFVSLPLVLSTRSHFDINHQWILYLPALALAYLTIFPLIILSEKKRCLKQALLIAIVTLALSELGLWFSYTKTWALGISLFFFFTSFSFTEASLPSLVSKIAPVKYRGTAIGIYSSAQFLGIFCGGIIGGYFTSHHELTLTFLFLALIALVWLFFAVFMRQPPYLSLKIISLKQIETSKIAKLQAQLLTIPGIKDVALVPREEAAYLKVDKKLLDEAALTDVIADLNLVK